MSWYKVNFSVWTKYLTSIQWSCLLLVTSWSTTSAKTDIFYYWFVTDTDNVCLFVWNIWILNFSAWGWRWWPRTGDLGWWWQNESPRQQCSTSSRGGYCPRQQCSTVPPSCVLPPPSSVPSSFDIDVHICTSYVFRRRLLVLVTSQCWKNLQKSSKPPVNEDVFQARGRFIFSCVKEERRKGANVHIIENWCQNWRALLSDLRCTGWRQALNWVQLAGKNKFAI